LLFYQAAAYRELLEETGLSITKHAFDPYSTYFESAYINPRTGKQKKVVVWAAMVDAEAAVTIQPEEILSYKWMPLDQAHTLASFKEDRESLAELVRLLAGSAPPASS
jgi:8-oxo-dGTP pyrophosphatase MutT (NUDIX family)